MIKFKVSTKILVEFLLIKIIIKLAADVATERHRNYFYCYY
jgi:hypothetical protein